MYYGHLQETGTPPYTSDTVKKSDMYLTFWISALNMSFLISNKSKQRLCFISKKLIKKTSFMTL